MTWLRLFLVPDLLTSRIDSLTVPQAHWLAKRMGIYEGLHDWLHGFCPCQADTDESTRRAA